MDGGPIDALTEMTSVPSDATSLAQRSIARVMRSVVFGLISLMRIYTFFLERTESTSEITFMPRYTMRGMNFLQEKFDTDFLSAMIQ
jgi:hypothetical protein